VWQAAAAGGGDGAADCGVCAICLDKIALQDTALVKGCDHAYWFVSPSLPDPLPPPPI
jgi:hypothetical protein